MASSTLCNFQTEGYKNQAIEPLKTIGVQDLLQDDDFIAHVGWLYKRDHPKSQKTIDGKLRHIVTKVRSPWKNFYTVIRKGCVYIYPSDESKKPKTTFSLAGYLRVMRAEDVASPEGKSFTFKLIHKSPEKKTWYFATGSHRELQLWMAVIKSEMEKISQGEVSRQTQKLVIGLKRPSLKQSLDTVSLDSISLDDDDAVYNALEVGVKYNTHTYNDVGDSDDENNSSSDYESPVDEEEEELKEKRMSTIDRPLPTIPKTDSIASRPPAPIPGGFSSTLPGGNKSVSHRPQMPLPSTLPTETKPPKPNVFPTTTAPSLRPWENKPTVAPRPGLPTSGGVSPLGNKGGAFAAFQKQLNKTVGQANLTTNLTDDLPSRPPPKPDDRQRRPDIGNRPKLPTRPVKEDVLLPVSANIASSDKTMTERFLNEHKTPGMYLVRESREPGTQVVVVFDGPKRSCLHYKVFTRDGQMYLQPDDPSFNTLEEMLKYYKSHPLPTTKQQLTKPYHG